DYYEKATLNPMIFPPMGQSYIRLKTNERLVNLLLEVEFIDESFLPGTIQNEFSAIWTKINPQSAARKNTILSAFTVVSTLYLGFFIISSMQRRHVQGPNLQPKFIEFVDNTIYTSHQVIVRIENMRRSVPSKEWAIILEDVLEENKELFHGTGVFPSIHSTILHQIRSLSGFTKYVNQWKVSQISCIFRINIFCAHQKFDGILIRIKKPRKGRNKEQQKKVHLTGTNLQVGFDSSKRQIGA
ncbi:2143_t:CDS:2, partial [Acaulospora morrowiae]